MGIVKRVWVEYNRFLALPIVGAILAILLYFLEGTNKWFAGLILLLSLSLPLVKIIFDEWRRKSDRIALLQETERIYNYVGRVINESGDLVSVERERFRKLKDGRLEYLESKYIRTPGTSIHISHPKVIASSVNGISINKHYETQYPHEVPIGDNKQQYLFCEYAFKVSPPLYKQDDYIEYEVEVQLLGDAKQTFSETGDVAGCFVRTHDKEINFKIAAPAGYRVQVLDYWIQDSQGTKVSELTQRMRNDPPIVSSNDTEWQWHISYPVFSHYYLVRYRFSKSKV